ncbi:Hsp20/alpha crystallin family protein [Fictibacillus nanhaiensis]|uniref:Hsp20/alpha crystallin family protein n=1 Tax=Fictibacillus nanhaiensis TaxID=742169 RepID=UPI003C23FEE8
MLGKGPLMPFFNNRSMDDWLNSFEQYVNKGLNQFEKFADQMSFEVDTEETTDDYKIRANLKDYNPEDLQIEILNQGLQIKAQREEVRSTKNKRTGHFQQRKAMKRTERFVQLPFMFRNEDVKAQYTNGILTISVNKNGGEVMNPTVPIQVVTNSSDNSVEKDSNANNTANVVTNNGQFEE